VVERKCLAARARQAFLVARTPPYLLLLPPPDFFSPPWLLRLLLPRALARSLCALLFWVLALPPLLAACERLELPLDEEDLEFRDAIEMLLGCGADGAGARRPQHGL
jgi:hypothetical protein